MDICKNIFKVIDRIAHKILHIEKNENNNNKICQIYKDLNKLEFKENDKGVR